MRFVCLGYMDETRWAQMSKSERSAFIDDCFAYDDELKRGGHFLGGEALRDIHDAATLRLKDGKVAVSDGPCDLTNEHLGGLLFLEARDLNHAIQLMSKHPGIRAGALEIRPSHKEMSVQIAARNP
jgi:hypothetical protein